MADNEYKGPQILNLGQMLREAERQQNEWRKAPRIDDHLEAMLDDWDHKVPICPPPGHEKLRELLAAMVEEISGLRKRVSELEAGRG